MGYFLTQDGINAVLERWMDDYLIYAPVRMAGGGGGSCRAAGNDAFYYTSAAQSRFPRRKHLDFTGAKNVLRDWQMRPLQGE